LRIGDTLSEGEDINLWACPLLRREIVRRVRLTDAMKAKKLKEALQQMSEEGVVQVFRPRDGAPALVGVVGPLQLDVLKARLDAEYSLPVDSRSRNSSWRAGFPPMTARNSRPSSPPTAPASPTTSTAIRCFWRRTSSISATPRSAPRASCFPSIKDVKKK